MHLRDRKFCQYEPSIAVSLVLAFFIAIVASACSKQVPLERPGTTDLRVVDLNLVGVRSVDEGELREGLATQERRALRNPFERASHFYNQYDFEADMDRIEAFYQARGFFDVRVMPPTEQEDEERDRMRLRVEIIEGESTTVSSIHVEAPSLPLDVVEAIVSRNLNAQQNDRYDDETAQRWQGDIARRLHNLGYAYALVDLRVYVNRAERRADIYYFVDPGPECVIGEVRIEGNERISPDTIHEIISLQEGTPYRRGALELAERQLYDTGAFTNAAVTPVLGIETEATEIESYWDGEQMVRQSTMRLTVITNNPSAGTLSPGTLIAQAGDGTPVLVGSDNADQSADESADVGNADGTASPGPPLVPTTGIGDAQGELTSGELSRNPSVPVLITLQEGPRASYRLVSGLGLQSGRSEAYGRAVANWSDVLYELNTIELDLRLGYAWIPSVFAITEDEQNSDVIGDAELTYALPAAILNYFDFAASIGYERGIEPEYEFGQPSASIALSRRLTSNTTFLLAYTVNIFFTHQDTLVSGAENDLPSDFRLAYFSSELRYDGRDDPLRPTRGFLTGIGVELGENLSPFGEFAYIGIRPEVRAYKPFGRRFVWAARLELGGILELGDAAVPRTQRYYLGGGDSVRGFPYRRLSPYGEARNRSEPVPVGGRTFALANTELRWEVGLNWLELVAFVDAGTVSLEEGRWDLNPFSDILTSTGLSIGTGLGIRLLTPIGPVRLDLARRLTASASSIDLPAITVYFGIGEAF